MAQREVLNIMRLPDGTHAWNTWKVWIPFKGVRSKCLEPH